MKVFKSLKTLVLAMTVALTFAVPVAAAESCWAMAKLCNASCDVVAPPGGSVICRNLINGAVCTSFDANGNVVLTLQDSCSILP